MGVSYYMQKLRNGRVTFVVCHFFDNHECSTRGPNGGQLRPGDACPGQNGVACAQHGVVQPHPPQCLLLPEYFGEWLRSRVLSPEQLERLTQLATSSVLPAIAKVLGFASVEALCNFARADRPVSGGTRRAAISRLVAELRELHDAEFARIGAAGLPLNSSTPPEEIPAPGASDAFLVLCLANYGKRGNRRLDLPSWALAALMEWSSKGGELGAITDLFSAFADENSRVTAAEPKAPSALAYASKVADVIAKHALAGGVGTIEVMGKTPRKEMARALSAAGALVGDVSAAMRTFVKALCEMFGIKGDAVDFFLGSARDFVCRSRSAFFASTLPSCTTRAWRT